MMKSIHNRSEPASSGPSRLWVFELTQPGRWVPA